MSTRLSKLWKALSAEEKKPYEVGAAATLLPALHAAEYSYEADNDYPVCRTRRLHRLCKFWVTPQRPQLARRFVPGLPIR